MKTRGSSVRIQSRAAHNNNLDPYFTPREATISLIQLERIPECLWEPAAGDGAISKILLAAGYKVFSSDIEDYGYSDSSLLDYMASTVLADGIITNPPYRLALAFARKAISEVRYVALLLRTNFLESTARLPFFRETPPSRVWVASRRLPMMHRLGWDGPKAPSNTCHAWFVWDRRGGPLGGCRVGWYDYREEMDKFFASERGVRLLRSREKRAMLMG